MPPASWPVCFGLETEIGIAVAGRPDADVVEESIRLVRAAAAHGAAHLWDYATEDPHVDARGFRVRELRQDTDESHYFSQDASRPYSFQEIKSDLVLRNGARFYNDHAHPEYSTPECGTLAELVAQDKAGERILEECAHAVGKESGSTVRLYKNNTDFRGHSYGCHDNYLVPRAIPWERLVASMTPFLVTRQLFAGAGKTGWESEDMALHGGYQISQRADFFTELVSIDTMNRRPLINTRDEPHADPTRWRRFHVILGDANLSGYATWLKVGTTALVLEALRHEGLPEELQLAEPIHAHMAISRDTEWRWLVKRAGGGTCRATDIQRAIADWVEPRISFVHPEQRQVLAAWRDTLDTLERDPLALADRLDWVAKYALLDRFRESEGLTWQDPWLQSLDLEYHLLDHAGGLYYGLESAGAILPAVSEADVLNAISQPPTSTRAYLRGRVVQRFGAALIAAHWDHLVFKHAGRTFRLNLGNVWNADELARLSNVLDAAPDLPSFLQEAAILPER